MNFGRVRKVAALKLLRLFSAVDLNEGNLLVVCRVLRPDALQAAVVQGLEDMRGLFEIEGHDLSAAGGSLGLTGRSGGSFHAGTAPTMVITVRNVLAARNRVALHRSLEQIEVTFTASLLSMLMSWVSLHQ
jgi:hypothetical protein